MPGPLDHVVLSVASLVEARRLFEALGFRVAPDAVHPFGTGNACIFFEDGTYIEPLAVIDRELAESNASGGNAFVRHDLAYRLRHGVPGLTGIALRSVDADADADDKRFERKGFDGGDILEFARLLQGSDGAMAELRFRLAFAHDRRSPMLLFFACQRLFDLPLGRGGLTAHPNGVRGITRLIFADDEPEMGRPICETVLEADDLVSNSLGFSITSAGRAFEVLSAEALAARYGISAGGEGGTRFLGCVLATDRLAEIHRYALDARLDTHQALGRLVVPIGPDGTFLAFEEPS